MEDIDLIMLAFILAGAVFILSLFTLISFLPDLGILNLILACVPSVSIALLYFIQSKRIATGYWRLPDDLKELHEKVKEIETYEPEERKEKKRQRREI